MNLKTTTTNTLAIAMLALTSCSADYYHPTQQEITNLFY